MKTIITVFLVFVFGGAVGSSAAVIDLPIDSSSNSGDKSNFIEFEVPIDNLRPCITASVVIFLTCEEMTEVGIGYETGEGVVLTDQLSVGDNGDFIFDISRGIRFAQSIGLPNQSFVVQDLFGAQGKNIGVVAPDGIIGKATLVYNFGVSRTSNTDSNDDGSTERQAGKMGFSGTLLSVFPNPFNPRTSISFKLSKASYVHLAIYDVRGKLTKLLHSGSLASGGHEFSWAGRDNSGRRVASGIYFYQFKTPFELASGKMMLLK
jgi:hypothetical protein